MSLDPDAILNALQAHAMSSGWFERVNGHEPTNPPGNGVTLGIWVQEMWAINASGLSSSSVRVAFTARVQTSMQSLPLDLIDPHVLKATAALFAAYNGDFELGGQARHIDILGRHGDRLSARAAYLDVDTVTYRVMDITVPVIVNDAWTQEA